MGKVPSRILLNIGFVSGLRLEDIRDIGKGLTYKAEHREQHALFGDMLARFSDTVRSHIDKYWGMMVELGTVDVVRRVINESAEKARRMVDLDTMRHTDAREIGAEWLCLQAIRQLELDKPWDVILQLPNSMR